VDFGHDALRQPGAMTADRYGRLYVMDAGDRHIKVFRGRRLVASIGYAGLGLMAPTAIAADESTLYVADGPASRVALFRIAAPAKGEEK
jgi:sugar lactone lactonase YvrE